DVRFFIRDDAPDAEPYPFSRYLFVLLELGPERGWAAPPGGTDFTEDNLKQVCDNARRAHEVTDQELADALCSIVNPPGRPCDDVCVLLACVSVKDCKIVAICNLVRTIILSPAALGYWLPLQELLQALCCDKATTGSRLQRVAELFSPFQTAGHRFFVREK